MSCEYVHPEWGRCQQRGRGAYQLCYYHLKCEEPGFYRDRYYERKIVKGLLEPTEEYITPVEMDTLFRGRARHDGRRLDAWTKL